MKNKKRLTIIVSITLMLIFAVGNWYYAAYKSAMRRAVSLKKDTLSYEDGEDSSETSNEVIPEGTEPEINNEEMSEGTEPEINNEEMSEGTEPEINNEEMLEGTEPEINNEEMPEGTELEKSNEEIPEGTKPEINNDGVSEGAVVDKSETSLSLNEKIDEVEVLEESDIEIIESKNEIIYYSADMTDTSYLEMLRLMPELYEGLTYNGNEQSLIKSAEKAQGFSIVYGCSSSENVYPTEWYNDYRYLKRKDAGKYFVFYKKADDGNEYSIPAGAVTISPATMSVTATGFTGAYDGGDHGITINAPSDATVKYGKSDGSYTLNSCPVYKDAGTYTVYYQVTKANYKTVTGSQTVVISPKTVSVTWENKTSFEYNGQPHAPAIEEEISGVNGETLHITRTTNKNKGDYTSTASISSVTGGQANKANYKLTNQTKDYSITARPLTDTSISISLDVSEYVYDKTEHKPVVSITDNLSGEKVALVGNDDYTVAYSDNINAGTAKVNITGKGNYSGKIEKTFTINKRPVTVTPDNKNVEYGSADVALTYTAEGLVEGDKLVGINLSRESGTDIGTYNISASADDDANPNYIITFVNGTYYIIPRATKIKITLSQDEYVYSGKECKPSVTVVNAENDEEIPFYEYQVNYTNNKDAGTATVTVSDRPDSKNYNIEANSVDFTIIPKPITVEAEDKTKGYGDEDPTFTYKVTEGELAENDELTGLSFVRAQGDEIGNYTIEIEQKVGSNPNYEILFGSGTLTIIKGTIKNTAVNGVEAVYDGKSHKLDVTIPEKATVTYALEKGKYTLEDNPEFKDAGTYTVYYKIEIDDNYETIEGAKDVVISPKKITLTTTDKTKFCGEDDPTFGYTVDEMVGDDTLEGVTITRESGEEAGEYLLQASVDKDKNPNYDITIVNAGKLTIENKEPGTVEITNPETSNAGGAALEESSEGIISKVELTDEEKEAQEDGKNIYIFLEVGDISNNVSAADKKLVEDLINSSFEELGIEADKSDVELKVGMYLDINLYKQIEGESKEKISETAGAVAISIQIPENLRKDDRIFYIVRIHDGVATLIKPFQSGNTLTFETDQFSTYALVYIDKVDLSKTEEKTADTPATDTPAVDTKTTETAQTTKVTPKAETTPTIKATSDKSTQVNATASTKTGDDFNTGILLCMMSISLLGAVGLTIIEKKTNE